MLFLVSTILELGRQYIYIFFVFTIGVWICPGVCKPSSQLWLNSSIVLWMERETPLSNLRCLAPYPFMGNASGENPEPKQESLNRRVSTGVRY
jgi:hypothetical protein